MQAAERARATAPPPSIARVDTPPDRSPHGRRRHRAARERAVQPSAGPRRIARDRVPPMPTPAARSAARHAEDRRMSPIFAATSGSTSGARRCRLPATNVGPLGRGDRLRRAPTPRRSRSSVSRDPRSLLLLATPASERRTAGATGLDGPPRRDARPRYEAAGRPRRCGRLDRRRDALNAHRRSPTVSSHACQRPPSATRAAHRSTATRAAVISTVSSDRSERRVRRPDRPVRHLRCRDCHR